MIPSPPFGTPVAVGAAVGGGLAVGVAVTAGVIVGDAVSVGVSAGVIVGDAVSVGVSVGVSGWAHTGPGRKRHPIIMTQAAVRMNVPLG
jgi:hypothetical protein